MTVLAGQTSAVYTVPTVGDQADEPNGQVTVAIDTAAGRYMVGSPGDAAVTATLVADALGCLERRSLRDALSW